MLYRGTDFRPEFKKLYALKAIFPTLPVLAVTATATPSTTKMISQDLAMSNYRLVKESPDRPNLFLDRKTRLDTWYGNTSYEEILMPIAQSLKVKREMYPLTIIYMRFQYCGFAYRLFERTLKGNQQYVDYKPKPKNRLFAQFHKMTTQAMKCEILYEITSSQSNARVIFATTALGMGVNAQGVERVLHIAPPSTLTAYMQEIGRAGRHTDSQASAILYFCKSDVSKKRIDDGYISREMAEYCQTSTCLRSFLLENFGFSKKKLKWCCSSCNDTISCNDIDQQQPNAEIALTQEISQDNRDMSLLELNELIVQAAQNDDEFIFCKIIDGTYKMY